MQLANNGTMGSSGNTTDGEDKLGTLADNQEPHIK